MDWPQWASLFFGIFSYDLRNYNFPGNFYLVGLQQLEYGNCHSSLK